jgi:hypothetical protein
MILLISASLVARIKSVSHQLPARKYLLNQAFDNYSLTPLHPRHWANCIHKANYFCVHGVFLKTQWKIMKMFEKKDL